MPMLLLPLCHREDSVGCTRNDAFVFWQWFGCWYGTRPLLNFCACDRSSAKTLALPHIVESLWRCHSLSSPNLNEEIDSRFYAEWLWGCRPSPTYIICYREPLSFCAVGLFWRCKGTEYFHFSQIFLHVFQHVSLWLQKKSVPLPLIRGGTFFWEKV